MKLLCFLGLMVLDFCSATDDDVSILKIPDHAISDPESRNLYNILLSNGNNPKQQYTPIVRLVELHPNEPSLLWVQAQVAKQVTDKVLALDSCNQLLKLTDASKAVATCQEIETLFEEIYPQFVEQEIKRQTNLGDDFVFYRWKPLCALSGYTVTNEEEIMQETAKLQSDWVEVTKKFDEQSLNDTLSMLWSYHVGSAEGLYAIPDNIVEKVIIAADPLSHIMSVSDTKYVLDISEINDLDVINRVLGQQRRVLRETMTVIGRSETIDITPEFLKESHSNIIKAYPWYRVTSNAGVKVYERLVGGEYKLFPNSPVRADGKLHQFCPPSDVESEIEKLCDYCKSMRNEGNIDPFVQAAWLHHAFVSTHPFADGNGRVSRFITSVILMEHGLPPFVVTTDDKLEYVAVLNEANHQNLEPFVKFIQSQSKKTMDVLLGYHTAHNVPAPKYSDEPTKHNEL